VHLSNSLHRPTKGRPHWAHLDSWLNTKNDHPSHTHVHTHNRFTAIFPGPPGWAGARKLLDFMVQGKINRDRHRPSGLTSAHLHHTPIFYRPDALPATQPTVSKHWSPISVVTNSVPVCIKLSTEIIAKPLSHALQLPNFKHDAHIKNLSIYQSMLECGPMPNLMVALPNIGGALCPTLQSLVDAHY